jgi:hypothetical protein
MLPVRSQRSLPIRAGHRNVKASVLFEPMSNLLRRDLSAVEVVIALVVIVIAGAAPQRRRNTKAYRYMQPPAGLTAQRSAAQTARREV